MRAAFLQDAGYTDVYEPLISTATGRGSSPEQPPDLMRTFCILWFFLSEPGAAKQPLSSASPVAKSLSAAGRPVPGPQSSVSPPVQHLDSHQVKVRRVDVQKRMLPHSFLHRLTGCI